MNVLHANSIITFIIGVTVITAPEEIIINNNSIINAQNILKIMNRLSNLISFGVTIAPLVVAATYKAQIDVGGAVGYFDLAIANGQAQYTWALDLTSFSTTCDLSQGLTYHIHSYWNNEAATSASLSECGASYTGGHYDPNLACSGSSQDISSLCVDLGRTSSSGYTYSCNSANYAQGHYALCELGDISGKFGRAYATSDKQFSSQGILIDYQPEYNANYQNADLVSKQWASIVFHCGQDSSRLVCAKLEETSVSTVVSEVEPTFYKSSIDADGATGYFDLEIDNGKALYNWYLDLTEFSTTCDLSQGLTYHIHSYWTDDTTSSATLGACASTYTGGHYDPNLACSGSSQDIAGLCVDINRTAALGYTYSCSPSNYADGHYALCEVGDISGKFGRAYASTGKIFSSGGEIVDYQPPYNANYQASDAVSKQWTSIVFHCGQDSSRLVCGKLFGVDAPTPSPSLAPSSSSSAPSSSSSTLSPTVTNEDNSSSGNDKKDVTKTTGFIAGITIAVIVVVVVIVVAAW
jgi:hypothetical protein